MRGEQAMAGPGSPKTGGRERGTPNKVSKALKEMILGALGDAGGQQYLARVAEEQPAAFLTLLGKVLPTTLAGDKENPLRTVTHIELVPIAPRQ
jgi:hypothetical protein